MQEEVKVFAAGLAETGQRKNKFLAILAVMLIAIAVRVGSIAIASQWDQASAQPSLQLRQAVISC
jgi:hypothetical protein